MTDDLGPTAQGCAELRVAVTNVAQTLSLPVSAPVAEGTLVTLEASATDPGTTDKVSGTWTVTAADGAGGTMSAEVLVTVTNVVPTLTLPAAPEDAREGGPSRSSPR